MSEPARFVSLIPPPAVNNPTPATLLIQNADCVATMDDAGTEWRHASIVIQGGTIVACGPTDSLAPEWLEAPPRSSTRGDTSSFRAW